MEKVLIAGLGEVGRPIYEIASETGKYIVYGVDVDPGKTVDRFEDVPRGIDFLHVCFPYSPKFISHVVEYVARYEPRAIIIHSTVAPGTTRKIYSETGVPTAYSPVRGKHPHIKKHLLFWPKWVSELPGRGDATDHLSSLGFKVKISRSPESLELAKIYETVYRAAMIAFWQEAHRSARKLGADISVVAEFIAEVHRVLGDRPVYYPSYIGGHCLIPNTRIIQEVYPSKLWDFILESNEKRLDEEKEPGIAEDIEKVKRIWEKLVPQWYYRGEAREVDFGF